MPRFAPHEAPHRRTNFRILCAKQNGRSEPRRVSTATSGRPLCTEISILVLRDVLSGNNLVISIAEVIGILPDGAWQVCPKVVIRTSHLYVYANSASMK